MQQPLQSQHTSKQQTTRLVNFNGYGSGLSCFNLTYQPNGQVGTLKYRTYQHTCVQQPLQSQQTSGQLTTRLVDNVGYPSGLTRSNDP